MTIVTQTAYVRFACDHEMTLIPGDAMPPACPACYPHVVAPWPQPTLKRTTGTRG